MTVFIGIFGSCSTTNDTDDVIIQTEALNVVRIKHAVGKNYFMETYSTFLKSLNSIDAITIVAEVDHSSNASSMGSVLNPTRIVFGL